MKRLVSVIAIGLLMVSGEAGARQASTSDLLEIQLNEDLKGHLDENDTHSYALELEAEQFVLGAANQQTVDVVVTVYGPDGTIIGVYDNPARGLEPFQFDSGTPGRYRIEVKPFEQETGDYTLQVTRIEPLARTPEARVDQLLAAYDRNDSPGAVVAVLKEGELVFSKAYGMAHLSYAIPFTTETLTNIGSTSKQFTAFAIALLADQGKLSLDDDVRIHIPELPDLGKSVTLRHLMTHTSGYREFLNTIALTGRQLNEGEYIDRKELIEIVQRQPMLQNDPGSEWNYNNTGFGLLTVVVERVTGQPFQDWMKENVFEPLGMHHTWFRKNQSEIVPNSALGYLTDEAGAYREARDLGGAMGAGGVYTTVTDLATWMTNYHEPKVGNARLVAEMTNPYVLTTGDTTGYGLGLFIDEQGGLKRFQHGGADIAHRSMFMYFPSINSGVVALSNFGDFSNPASKIAEAFLGELMKQEASIEVTQNESDEFDPASYLAEDFDELTGQYALDAAPAFILTFTREDEKLYTQATGQPRLEIFPTSDSTFRLTTVEASMTFHRNQDGDVRTMTLHQNGNQRATRLEETPWAPSEDEASAYAGRYFSEELETFYTVATSDSGLVVSQRRLKDIELTPTEKDHFSGGGFPIGELVFTRNENGDVDGLSVSNGRTRGVRFDRLP